MMAPFRNHAAAPDRYSSGFRPADLLRNNLKRGIKGLLYLILHNFLDILVRRGRPYRLPQLSTYCFLLRPLSEARSDLLKQVFETKACPNPQLVEWARPNLPRSLPVSSAKGSGKLGDLFGRTPRLRACRGVRQSCRGIRARHLAKANRRRATGSNKKWCPVRDYLCWPEKLKLLGPWVKS